MGHGNHQQDAGKKCGVNQRYPASEGSAKPQVKGQSMWTAMSSKIPMKVVFPFLVISIVLISVMQFGKPNVVLLLQTNRSSDDFTTDLSQAIADTNGIVAAGVVSFTHQEDQSKESKINVEILEETDNSIQQGTSKEQLSKSNLIKTDDFLEKLPEIQCKPAKDKLVFIKTHKTASTTVATIFERYGYGRNLTFALPWVTHIFHESKLFNRDMVMTFIDQSTFDMLTNHARFNRKEMEVVVPRAKYVTIIRDPVTQFESAFGYFEMAKSLGLTNKEDPLAAFLENPKKYFRKSFHMKVQSYNGQMYDLGLNHTFQNKTSKVEEHIAKLDTELDLVMLTEYMDESLILLRKLMCWSYEDILYLSKGVRNKKHRYNMSPEVAEEIREWNTADLELYRHFNRTFWQKVNEYGPNFDRDLQRFRELQKNMTSVCLDTNKEGWDDYRETSYAKKKNAPDICDDLVRGDQEYVLLIRWREVRTEFGLVKLLAMIAGGIVLLIIVLTMLLFIIAKCVGRFCKRIRRKSGAGKKSKYSKLPNSDV